jgi:hypothetical protein
MSHKMKNKLTALCNWLHSQGIDDYIEGMRDESGVRIDLYLPTQNIAVHLSDGKNQLFYRRTCTEYRPFFIRSFETDEFIIEKMRNCIEGHSCKTAPKRKKSDPRPMIKKRQRIMVNAQRVRTP